MPLDFGHKWENLENQSGRREKVHKPHKSPGLGLRRIFLLKLLFFFSPMDLSEVQLENLDTSPDEKSLVISFKGGASQGRKKGHWRNDDRSRGIVQLYHPTHSASLPDDDNNNNNNTQLRAAEPSRRRSPTAASKQRKRVCPVKTLQWKLITR